MKRLLLSFTLAVLGAMASQAQDQDPTQHGPVVYPGSTSPDAYTNNPASSGPFAVSNAVPGDVAPNPLPSAPNMIPAQPGSNPALNPLSGVASAASGNGQADDIYDIRPPYFYLKPLTWLWISLGVLAAIALAVALWFWLAPLRSRRLKTPYEQALERLEKARSMLNEQDPEPYAVFVSETIRTYLGQRFKTPVTRRTTEEFLRQMQADASTPLLAAHRDLLRAFLEACDLVKFAHYQPGRDELEQVQQRAVSFVTATRPVEGVPA